MKEGEGMLWQKEIDGAFCDRTAWVTVKELLYFLLLLVLAAIMFVICGCSPYIGKCDDVPRRTMYASEKHMYYSVFGHKNTTIQDVYDSIDEGWWGCPVFFNPMAGPEGQGE